jgi:hypothetical protein
MSKVQLIDHHTSTGKVIDTWVLDDGQTETYTDGVLTAASGEGHPFNQPEPEPEAAALEGDSASEPEPEAESAEGGTVTAEIADLARSQEAEPKATENESAVSEVAEAVAEGKSASGKNDKRGGK